MVTPPIPSYMAKLHESEKTFMELVLFDKYIDSYAEVVQD